MSAKRPRARRSRMWRSVSTYGSAGAAPTTSSPSSSASRSRSEPCTWIVCRPCWRFGSTRTAARRCSSSNRFPIRRPARVRCTGGGVSTAGLAIAKALGAQTIVTSSSDEKLARATELGADATVNHASGDVKAAVREATGGRGADVVVEHVGEATWRTSLDVAAREGRVAVCGATSGPNPPAALHRIWWKQLTILGSTMGTRADFEGAYELVASGRARPVVDEVLPLEEIQAAHARLEAGEQLGKIVLEIPA